MNQSGSGAIEVFVFKDGRFLGSRCYSQATVVIGSGRSATLKLQDATVSDRHATVRIEGSSISLADNGSDTGVFVNNERVNVCTVSSFDEIAIGPFRLKISMLGQEDEDPGFGEEEGEHFEDDGVATVVRKVEEMPEYQQLKGGYPDQPEEVTLPRYRRPEPSRSLMDPSGFDEMKTSAAAPSLRPSRQPQFSAKGGLDAVATQPDAYEEMPTSAETPAGRKQADDGFEDFTKPPPEPVREEPAKVRSYPPPKEAYPEAYPDRYPEDRYPEDRYPEDRYPEDRYPEEELAPEKPEPASVVVEGDEDEDDEAFVPPFSLLENIVRERFKTRTETEPFPVVEVIHYEGKEIQNLLRANPGKRVRIGVDDFNLVTHERGGRASIYFGRDFKGTLVSRGKARPLKTFCNDKFQADRKGRLFAVSLTEGDYAQIIRGSSGYLVRFVRAPTQPKMNLTVGQVLLGLTGGALGLQIFVGSAAFHFLVLVLLGFVAPEANLTVVSDAERFAKVAMKDLKLEKPKDEPKKQQEEVKPQKVEDAPKVKKRVRRVVKRPGPISAARKKRIQKKQVANVLSALENIRPKGASPGRSNLKALASNIAAIRVPGGTSSSFKVAGVISKIPGGGVRLAGGLGGGGGKDTRVGSQLLSGGSIGKIAAAKGTGTRVRGRVRRAPKRAIRATGGVLDRGAIQKVVNAHMAAIQRCYEVQLLKSPGLAGKIVFDWTISMSGGVSSARQVSSSMRSPAVATCILAQIRTWRFPRPVGGAVQVRYPFVFRVQGF